MVASDARMRRSIGVAMIDAAEAEGKIKPGKTTLVEPTSGARAVKTLAFASQLPCVLAL
jgi:cysteine synthase A